MNKETVKEKLSLAKEHVKRQKAAYICGAIAIAAIALQQSNVKAFYEFLDAKGISRDEYLLPEYYEELNASK
jgi:hypothetical protein